MAERYRSIPPLNAQDTARFLSHVCVLSADDCWPWQACRDKDGYGVFGVTPIGNLRAHRVAYFIDQGVDPQTLLVLHHCDNPPCCNPAHLFLGTLLDNNADKQAKGRQARGLQQGQHTRPECFPKGDDHYARKKPYLVRRGEQHSMAKLTEADVRDIFRRWSNGEKQIDIARDYGLTIGPIHSIVKRKTWKHLNL